MTGLTPDQRQLIAEAGDRPVRIEDCETHETYVLMRANVYERMRGVVEPSAQAGVEIPEGIKRSQAAFFRDLPDLLKDRRLKGKYIAYHGSERIGIAEDDETLIRACLRRGLSRDEYDILVIEAQPAEPEEIDGPTSWHNA